MIEQYSAIEVAQPLFPSAAHNGHSPTWAGPSNSHGPQQSLAHLCEDTFAFILSIRAGTGERDMHALYRRAEDTLEDLRRQAAAAGIAAGVIQAASFALAAFIDEAVTQSPWADRNEWPFLQYQHFHTRRAGSQFFEQLAALHGGQPGAVLPGLSADAGPRTSVWKDPERAAVLEVFYTCLLLGFTGELATATPEYARRYLDLVRAHCLLKPAGPLAPHLLPRPATATRERHWSPWLWCALGLYCLLIAGILLLFVAGTVYR